MSYQAGLPFDPPPEQPAPPRDPLLIVMACLLSTLLWLAVVGQLIFVVPRIERAFGEFKMKIPWLMEQVVYAYRWWVPAIMIAALVIGIVFGHRSRWIWPCLLIVLPLAINVVVGVSVYFPYMELLDGLEGGGKK